MNTLRIVAVAAAIVASGSSFGQAIPSEANANDISFKQIKLYDAWSRGYTGKGIRVAVVDTGADMLNNDMKNIILAKSVYTPTMVDANRGHGTGMISLVAGTKDGTGVVGVAYDASVLAYAAGVSGFVFNYDVSNGIKWSSDNKADVINLSIGQRLTTPYFNVYYNNLGNGVYARKPNVMDAYSYKELLPVLQYATSKGSVVVMAAGNDGNPVPTSPANIAVQTDANGNLLLGGRALIVGAVDRQNVIASFSNRAGHICQNLVNSVCTDKVQVKDYFVVAPGGNLIWTANANGGTKIVQDLGTSPAAAFVSGGVAVIKQAWPTLRPEQIVQVLLKTATDLGAPGVDEIYGNGLINLDAATKPLGATTLAKITNVANSQLVGSNLLLSASSLVGGTIAKQSFLNSDLLKNVQFIDEIGRNYTVDMTKGITNNLNTNYSPISLYSNLSETKMNVASFNEGSVNGYTYGSANTFGVRFDVNVDPSTDVGFERGIAKEHKGLLGAKGYGAFQTGDSVTNWNALHVTKKLDKNSSVYASYAQGATVGTAGGVITSFDTIKSRGWSVGYQQSNLINDNDKFAIQLTALPQVTSGNANLSAVTGYTYSDDGLATAVVQHEKLSLRTSYQQYATSFGYSQPVDNQSNIMYNLLIQSDNDQSKIKTNVNVVYNVKF